jgi:hypothetical protein
MSFAIRKIKIDVKNWHSKFMIYHVEERRPELGVKRKNSNICKSSSK